MQAGSVLADRYELLGPLGQGASSAVWEALDRQSGERVAVKAVSLDEAGWRAEVRDRFQQEARLLALGRHEHLVAVHDVGETDDGFLYLVLERLHGETLADRIARAPRMSWREAAGVAREIAEGLSALHARGIVHRDLKPANVILHEPRSGESVAKIIDLGISKVRAAAAHPAGLATLTATGQVLGTPEYMSAEQALGERDVDARSDVWALGVVLYEMLGGRRPFEGANVNAVLAAIRKGQPAKLGELSPGVPAAVVAVVERCLVRERGARFGDGRELSEGLGKAIAEGEREEAGKVRRRRAVVVAAVVGVGAIIGGAVWLRGVGESVKPPLVEPRASASGPEPRPSGSGDATGTATATVTVTGAATVIGTATATGIATATASASEVVTVSATGSVVVPRPVHTATRINDAGF